MEFITNKICPFAHRAWLALEETHAPYVLREASLSDKPEWFTAIYRSALGADTSSDGKVPVLKDGDFVLTESAVVADYVITKYGKDSSIAPIASPEDRARAAIFAEQQVPKMVKAWYNMLFAQEEVSQDAQRKEFLAAIAAISKAYERTAGPYFLGDKISLPDVLVWPHIARLAVPKHYRKLEIPETDEYKAFHRFVAAMMSRPAVIATQMPDEYFIDGYQSYANGSRNPK